MTSSVSQSDSSKCHQRCAELTTVAGSNLLLWKCNDSEAFQLSRVIFLLRFASFFESVVSSPWKPTSFFLSPKSEMVPQPVGREPGWAEWTGLGTQTPVIDLRVLFSQQIRAFGTSDDLRAWPSFRSTRLLSADTTRHRLCWETLEFPMCTVSPCPLSGHRR